MPSQQIICEFLRKSRRGNGAGKKADQNSQNKTISRYKEEYLRFVGDLPDFFLL